MLFGKLTGGQAPLLATVPAGNANAPNDWEFLVQWDAPDNVPRECDLQITVPNSSNAVGFPPGVIGFQAGSRSDIDSVGVDAWLDVPAVVMRIELGGGPDARTIYADLRSGRFSLGPQVRAKVSFAAWGPLPPFSTPDQVTVYGSVVPPSSSGDYLTYSATKAITGAGSARVPLVPGAIWSEVYGDKSVAFQVGGSGGSGTGVQAIRPYSDPTAAFAPPFSPIPCAGGTQIFVLNLSADTANTTVVQWVR